MMARLFKMTLVRQRTLLLLFGALAVALPMLIGVTYRALGGGPGLEELWKLLPEGIKALTRAQGGFLPGMGATGYMAAGVRHPMLLVLLTAATVAVALAALAREVERGTILLLLARPIARWKVVVSRSAALAVIIAVLLALILVGFTVGFAAAGALGELQWLRLLLVLPNALALFLAIGGYSLLLSARASEGGQVMGPAAALTLLFFVLDYSSQLWEPLRPLGYVSLFHYYDPVGVAQSGVLPWRHLAVLLAVAAAGFGAAIVVFQRRDIAR